MRRILEAVGYEPQFDPRLTAEVVRDGTAVVLSGASALPDGTRLRYELWGGYMWGLVFGHRRRGELTLRDGRFEVHFDPAPWRGPELDVVVSIRGDRSQPMTTRDLIGDEGQRLMFADVGGEGYAEHFLGFRSRIGRHTASDIDGR